jgi:dipeptidyl aminopeptidase/acylaminoacyl peptidase
LCSVKVKIKTNIKLSESLAVSYRVESLMSARLFVVPQHANKPERIPATWKPYFKIALGDPENADERAFLIERSPKTHLHNMSAPMLVIQGRNDPRVVAAESEDLVRELKSKGKDIELLVFEDEGHDVLKYENRVTCYSAIADFFAKHLKP